MRDDDDENDVVKEIALNYGKQEMKKISRGKRKKTILTSSDTKGHINLILKQLFSYLEKQNDQPSLVKNKCQV